jgi:hypothetical protein
MSADNYYLIRKYDGRYVLSLGFYSEEGEPPILDDAPRFDDLGEALEYAAWRYSECVWTEPWDLE